MSPSRGRPPLAPILVLAGAILVCQPHASPAQTDDPTLESGLTLEDPGAPTRTPVATFSGLVDIVPGSPGPTPDARLRVGAAVRTVRVHDRVGRAICVTIRAADGSSRPTGRGGPDRPGRWREHEVILLEPPAGPIRADGSAARWVPAGAGQAPPELIAVVPAGPATGGESLALLREAGETLLVGPGERARDRRLSWVQQTCDEVLTLDQADASAAPRAQVTRRIVRRVTLEGPGGALEVEARETRGDARIEGMRDVFGRAYRLLGVFRRRGEVAVLDDRGIGVLVRPGDPVGRFRVDRVERLDPPGGEGVRRHSVTVVDAMTGVRTTYSLEERLARGAVVGREDPHRPVWIMGPGAESLPDEPGLGF